MDEFKKKVVFEKSREYSRFPVTGFWGGISPVGELTIDLFEDINGLPESVIMGLRNGVIQEIEINPEDQDIRRIVHAGISIPMHVVPTLIEWLQSKVKEYNNVQNQLMK